MDKAIIILVSALPTIYEAWTDRFGESKKEKTTDTIILVIATIVSLCLAYWLFDLNPVWPAILVLMWRFVAFDYLVHSFLKRYSENHKGINIWEYSGKSTHWHDQLAAKVPWKVRLFSRVIVAGLSIALFLFYDLR